MMNDAAIHPPSDGPPPSDDARAWSALWSRTRRGSIDLDGDDPVAAELRRHWTACGPWLASCRELADIGSGPAVLARHLRAAPGGEALADVRWCCVDAARLPEPSPDERWLRCRGDTDFVSAEPDGGTVDGLVSNFGLEYVPRPAWAAACARWLRPGGELRAVLHARDSVIDRATRRTLDDLALAFDGVMLFDRAQALLQVIRGLPADPQARSHHGVAERSAYNAAVDALKARMAEQGGRPAGALLELLQTLTEAVREALGGQVDAALARVAERQAAYADERRRLGAMQACAIDDAARRAMSHDLQAAGFEAPEWRPLTCAVGTVGWALQARRSG